MDDLRLLIDLHKGANRQGPGADADTERAIELAGIDRLAPLTIADIGCGTGASALVLARTLNAQITAVDFLQDFLDVLENRARQAGLSDKIRPLCASMDKLTFEEGQLDVIWSEGAIYNIGFAHGVSSWRRFLKPGGLLVASEISWLTETRPTEIEQHWQRAYPEIDTPAAKLRVLEQQGYSPVGYFALPVSSWMENYYDPMQTRFAGLIAEHANSAEARELIASERREIALYEKYKTYYGYGMYIARKSTGDAG